MQGVGNWAAAKTFCYQQHIGEENIHPCCKKYLRNKSIDNSPSYPFNIFMKLDVMRSDSEIIALAWDDKASFEMIEVQTGLSEKGIIKLMRRSLKPGSFRKWRERVSGRPAKHAKRSLNALSIDYADLQ